MAACETCWSAAYIDARLYGGHQVDHYHQRLIDDHQEDTADEHCR